MASMAVTSVAAPSAIAQLRAPGRVSAETIGMFMAKSSCSPLAQPPGRIERAPSRLVKAPTTSVEEAAPGDAWRPPNRSIAVPDKARHAERKKCRMSGCHERDKADLRHQAQARLCVIASPAAGLQVSCG